MFQPQFATPVKSGAKRQTIRPTPRFMPRVGDQESWRQWSGRPYRSKTIELAKVWLTLVQPIRIIQTVDSYFSITVGDDSPLLSAGCEELSRLDGFTSLPAMLAWFHNQHGNNFAGILIRGSDVPVDRLFQRAA